MKFMSNLYSKKHRK